MRRNTVITLDLADYSCDERVDEGGFWINSEDRYREIDVADLVDLDPVIDEDACEDIRDDLYHVMRMLRQKPPNIQEALMRAERAWAVFNRVAPEKASA